MKKLFDGKKTAQLGTEKNPVMVNVQTKKRAKEVESVFEEKGWKYSIEVDPDKPEDVNDLELLLNPTKNKAYIREKKELIQQNKVYFNDYLKNTIAEL